MGLGNESIFYVQIAGQPREEKAKSLEASV